MYWIFALLFIGVFREVRSQCESCPSYPTAVCRDGAFYIGNVRVQENCACGQQVSTCNTDPCSQEICHAYLPSRVTCVSDHCGGCNAAFYRDNAQVGCEGTVSVLEFFEVPDLLLIIWGHQVNSLEALRQANEDGALFFESDVRLENEGRADETLTPVMAHSTRDAASSTTTLDQYLNAAVGYQRGIKLDFKTDGAARQGIPLLANYRGLRPLPVWINADIWHGPDDFGVRMQPVNGSLIVELVNQYVPWATLSFGWATGLVKPETTYNATQIDEALAFCRDLSQHVTFAVRGGLARRSWPQVSRLLSASDRYTLTLWHSFIDQYTTEDISFIRAATNNSKVYYDLPDDTLAPLRNALSQTSSVSPLTQGMTAGNSATSLTTQGPTTPRTTPAPSTTSAASYVSSELSVMLLLCCLFW